MHANPHYGNHRWPTALNHPPVDRDRSSHPRHRLGQGLIRRLLVGSCVLLLGQAVTPSFGATTDLIPLDPNQQKAFGITLSAPKRASDTLTRRYPAQVAVPNRQMRVVAAPQGGVLSALLVAEGEQVSAGQVLAEMRSPGLVDIQSQYLEALTRLMLADSELERDQMLYREGVIAERRLLESKAKHRELVTQVEQRSQLLALAGLSSEDIDALKHSRKLGSTLPVHAPIAGVVLEQMVSTGQSVAAAAPLYRIGELNPLWIQIHVPVDQVDTLTVGGRVLLPGVNTEGVIITIGRMVHAEDQGVLVRAQVTEGTERLRPGQFVEVQLSSNGSQSGWRVPSAAVVRNAGNAYLFKASEGGFAVVPIQVIAEEERTAVVAGELNAGDQFAVSGVVALKAAWLGAQQ